MTGMGSLQKTRTPGIRPRMSILRPAGHAEGRMLHCTMNGGGNRGFRAARLVDFGGDGGTAGRRLEEFAGILVDRPLPQARGPWRRPAAWADATAVFAREPDGASPVDDGGPGGWRLAHPLPEPWLIDVPLAAAGSAGPTLVREVRPAPSGQVGVFLEQVEQWRWLFATTPRGASVLSLFGHSGAATLGLAAAGAEVVHVDASRQAIALARRNAAASGLAAAPIRWVCEDAATFIARERRRGAGYDGAVLDPPSWGHGPRRQAFAIDRHLAPLLADVAAVVRGAGSHGPAAPLLLTCHSPRWHHRRLHDTLATAFPDVPAGRIASGRLSCTDAAGRDVPLGDYARITPQP
jgi:23S rRNA (cytosine1962-C5)-methyltransferase